MLNAPDAPERPGTVWIDQRAEAQGSINAWCNTCVAFFVFVFALPAIGYTDWYLRELKEHHDAIRANEAATLANQAATLANQAATLAQREKELEFQTEAYLHNMLRKIVTANYTPTIFNEVPGTRAREYISRQQEDALRKSLRENIDGITYGFFMLVGESGSGKTTLMQNLLKNEYKEGILELSLSAEDMIRRRVEDKIPVIRQIKEGVLGIFGEDCYKHRKVAGKNFLDFIKLANQVREADLVEKGKDAHPLIIYIALESKKDLNYDTMKEFSGAFGSVATMLSSKAKSCKTIVELSKPAISDDIKRLRGSDQTDFEVNAMTEDEFLEIGKQVLKVSNDDQKLVDEYLKYYHDWLGGHTKTLTDLATEAQPASMHTLCCLCTISINHPQLSMLYRNHTLFITVETATDANKEQILGKLKMSMLSFITYKKKREKGSCPILAIVLSLQL